ncbi:MAG: hypothetical protein K5931_08420 [Lachnospiraceae bacterium]|nr:hypothetical protein [Lachnospiraceae bacterium]
MSSDRRKTILIGFTEDMYHVPIYCSKCGNVLVFKGGGTYECEECKSIEYDDWGIVREYLYDHPNASVLDIENDTGVARRTVTTMLREGKIHSVSKGGILHCKKCNKVIPYGHLCSECEKAIHQGAEQVARNELLKKHQSEIHVNLAHKANEDNGKMHSDIRF